MRGRWIPWLLGAWILVLFAVALTAPNPVAVAVEGGLQFEPAEIRLRVRVQPDARNRGLEVGVLLDGFPEPVQTSWEDLPGANARITRWITFRAVDAGWYTAYGAVLRPSADEPKWIGSTRFQVLSRGF